MDVWMREKTQFLGFMDGEVKSAERWSRRRKSAYRVGYERDRRRRRKEWMDGYRARHPCACGETDIACLVFHHVGDKDREISRIHTLRAIKAEAEKCVVMCANCHMKGHAGRARAEHKGLFK